VLFSHAGWVTALAFRRWWIHSIRDIYRLHLPFSVLIGPGWKNFSGVITPSFLYSIQFFITNWTLRSASMSLRGLPANWLCTVWRFVHLGIEARDADERRGVSEVYPRADPFLLRLAIQIFGCC